MIIIGSDHAGVDLKKKIVKKLEEDRIEFLDVTNFDNQEGDDYPDIACAVCTNVLRDCNHIGIVICGSGIGVSIASNKIKGIRAAVCYDLYTAEKARKDNNANVLCLGSRTENAKNFNLISSIIDTFINTFYEAGRHDRRLDKIRKLEEMETTEGGCKYGSSL